MTKRIRTVVLIVVFAIQGAILLADESQDAQLKELTNKIQKLDERVKKLGELTLPKYWKER